MACRMTRNAKLARQAAIAAIVVEIQPCTVRQVFYQCVVRGLVEKEETGYDKVQRDLAELRERGDVPFSAIVVNTRRRILRSTWLTRQMTLALHWLQPWTGNWVWTDDGGAIVFDGGFAIILSIESRLKMRKELDLLVGADDSFGDIGGPVLGHGALELVQYMANTDEKTARKIIAELEAVPV